MSRNVLYSLVFHVGVVAAAYAGLPELIRPPPLPPSAVAVDITDDSAFVQEAPAFAAARPADAPEPPERPEDGRPAAAPPRAPRPAAAPPRPPQEQRIRTAAVRVPERIAAPVPPPARAAPVPAPPVPPLPAEAGSRDEARPPPVPEPKPRPPAAGAPPPMPPPERPAGTAEAPPAPPTPPERNGFDDMLVNLAKTDPLAPAAPERGPEEEGPPARAWREATAAILNSIRSQIEHNWTRPPALKDAGEGGAMAVKLEFRLRRDGTIFDVEVSEADRRRLDADPLYRPFVDSAVLAVNKTRRITGLSPDDYEIWQHVRLNFKPRS